MIKDKHAGRHTGDEGKMPLAKKVSTNARPFVIQWLILGLGLLALGGAIAYSITREHSRIDALEQDRLATQAPEYFTGLLESVRYTPGVRASLIHDDGKIFVEVPGEKGLAGITSGWMAPVIREILWYSLIFSHTVRGR
jgi:hypothetical protein